MAYRVGDTLSESITVTDPDGTVTGITFTSSDVSGFYPDNSVIPFADITITELGSGVYEFEVEADQGAGTYTISVIPPVTDVNDWTLTWDVDAAIGVVSTLQGPTRAQLRKMILRKFGDLVEATAKENGTTTIFIDKTKLHLGAGMYKGREGIFVDGQAALLGQHFYVNGSSRDGGYIEFKEALPVATQTGDAIHMSNTHGIGVSIDAVNGAIDYVVEIAQDYAMVPISYDVTDAFDGVSSHGFVVPDEFIGVMDIQYLTTTGEWFTLQRANGGGQRGWFPGHGSRSIAMYGLPGSTANGRMVRILGYGLPTVPETDSDQVPLDVEWLVAEACAHLCNDIVMSRQASSDWAQKGQMYQNRADMLRPRIMPNIGPSFARF